MHATNVSTVATVHDHIFRCKKCSALTSMIAPLFIRPIYLLLFFVLIFVLAMQVMLSGPNEDLYLGCKLTFYCFFYYVLYIS